MPVLYNEVNLTVHVIGCGGTGSYLVRDLARLLSLKNKNISSNPTSINDNLKYTLILHDGDIVEEKNIQRQNFIREDIGKNKAAVLGERYSAAFEMPIFFEEEYVEPPEHGGSLSLARLTLNKYRMLPSIIISCVDNVATRKALQLLFKNGHIPVWIDSGNEENSGQVVISTTRFSRGYHNNSLSSAIDSNGTDFLYHVNLPSLFDVYPSMELIEDKFNSELSCAERAVSSPQHILTNMTAANIVLQAVNNVISNQLNYHHVTFNIVRCNTQTHFITKSMLIKFAELQRISCTDCLKEISAIECLDKATKEKYLAVATADNLHIAAKRYKLIGRKYTIM